ncbi:MAG TPA: hypothetical protein PLD77_03085 [Candidatus Dojkabacteria bacterium]|nr:hypothetical protein [Candidatus Dojkabacteria bacterium]
MKIKFNAKPLLSYISLAIASAILVAVILIALPLTEKISDGINFNLVTKDSSFWSKEYILTLQTSDEKQVRDTREILYRRLRSFSVERVSIYTLPSEEEGLSKLKVIISSAKDQALVEELIKNRFQYKIMTKKADVNFEDSEDQYAYMMEENYDPTDWDYQDFRNIYITKLKSNNGTYSYFALYKLWPNKEKEFVNFLSQYKGDIIGVSIDGYISPYQVPEDVDQSAFLFALPVYTEDEDEAEIISILYNSGNIPVEFIVQEETDLPSPIESIDYIKISIALIIALVTAYIYILIFKQSTPQKLLRSFLATVITISLYIAILKIQQIPVYTILLTLECIIASIATYMFEENKESRKFTLGILLLSLLIITFLGTGLMSEFAKGTICILLLSALSLKISKRYINKVRKI